MNRTEGPGSFPWEDEQAGGEGRRGGADAGGGDAADPNGAAADATAQEMEPAADTDAPGADGSTGDIPSAAAPGSDDTDGDPPAGGAAQRPASPVDGIDRSAARRAEGQRPLVRKEYYSISEVADIVGLPAHVLRYWETQFSVLNPSKNRSGNRVYQRKEIKLILLVKQLLHDEKYTVEGAKQKLDQLRRGGGIGQAAARALDDQLVRVLRDDLRTLHEILGTDRE